MDSYRSRDPRFADADVVFTLMGISRKVTGKHRVPDDHLSLDAPANRKAAKLQALRRISRVTSAASSHATSTYAERRLEGEGEGLKAEPMLV